MAQSQNTKVEYVEKASFLNGLTKTGQVMIGDKAFEFYNDRNVEDYIQIPWTEVDYVSAEVIGKSIPRFAIFIKEATPEGAQRRVWKAQGHFTFSTKDNKATLRAVREHVPAERLLRSPNFLDVTKKGIKSLIPGRKKEEV